MTSNSSTFGGQELPFIKKNQVILSEGVWKKHNYTTEEIRNAYLITDWKNKQKRHLYNDHLDVDPKDGAHIPTPVSSWVGFIQNPRFSEQGLIGDVEIWDPTIAFYLDKAKPKFGISATMGSNEDPGHFDMKRFQFLSFALVVNPGCKEAYMKLSDEEKGERVRLTTLSDEEESKLDIIERGSNLVKNMAKELETTDEVENTESKEVKEEVQPEAEAKEEVTEEKSEEKSEDETKEESKEEVKEEVTEEEPKVEKTEVEETKTEEKAEVPKVEDKKKEEKEEKEDVKTEKKLSEKTISELTVDELSEYSKFAVEYLSDNPDTPMGDVASAFEASKVKDKTLSDMSNEEMFSKITLMQSELSLRMGKTLSDESPKAEKVEEKTEEKEDPVEDKKVLSDSQDLKIKKLSDEIDLLNKKLSEPSTRKTLSDTSSNGAICEHDHDDAFQTMAGFISSGGQGSYTL